MPTDDSPEFRMVYDRVRSALNADGRVCWERTSIDLRHQIKAGRVAAGCMRMLGRIGVRSDVLDYLWPPLLHLEALVYRGDLDYEHAQRAGTSARSSWRAGVEELLRAYRCDDPVMLCAVAALDDYYEIEKSILDGRTPVSVELAREVCYRRCADIMLWIRFAFRLAGLTSNEKFFQLMRHVGAIADIVDDVLSYAEDVDERSFNIYRLSAWTFGPHAAEHRLRELVNDIKRALRHEIATTDQATLRLFAIALPKLTPAGQRLPTTLPRLLPHQLLPAYVTLRLACFDPWRRFRIPVPLPDPPPRGASAPKESAREAGTRAETVLTENPAPAQRHKH